MNLNLSPELEAFVNQQVRSGAYDSPQAVIVAALELLRRDPLMGIKREIREGDRQSKAGEFSTRSCQDFKREVRQTAS